MVWGGSRDSGLSLFGSVHELDLPPLPLSAAAEAAFGVAARVSVLWQIRAQDGIASGKLSPVTTWRCWDVRSATDLCKPNI
jgi:hypothetical protein